MSASYNCDICKSPATYTWHPDSPVERWEFRRAIPQAQMDLEMGERLPSDIDVCGSCQLKITETLRSLLKGVNIESRRAEESEPTGSG